MRPDVHVWRLIVIAVAVAAAACGSQAQPAVDRAPVVVDVPIGPLPGPGAGVETSSAEGGSMPEPVNPFATDKGALAEGRRFFVWYNCAGCHGDHGGGGMGPSLRDDSWLYGRTHAQVANSIVEGRAHGMPAWGRMLTEAQVWQITAYIKSLRTANEPEPPA